MRSRVVAARVAIGAALVLAVAPFLALSFFDHPQNDDYVFAVHARILGYVGANVDWYLHWSGRYLATAIMSASPVALGWLPGYRWIGVACVTLLATSVFALATTVAGAEASRSRRAAFAVALTAIFLHGMPNVPEGVYWMTGAVTYQLGSALLLFALASVLRAAREDSSRRRVLFTAAGAALALGACGTNELTGLHLVACLAAANGLVALRRRRVSGPLAVVLVFALAGFAADVLAPGTRARLEVESGHALGQALLESLRESGGYAWRWMTRGPLVPVTLLAFPAFVALARRRPRITPHPALSAVLLVGLIVVSFVPGFQGVGSVEPRTVNVVHWLFIVGVFWIAYSVAERVADRRAGLPIHYAPLARGALAAAAVLMTVLPPSNLSAAYADLTSGAAARYDAEQRLRYELIQACSGAVCPVPALSDPPRSLFFFENAVDTGRDDAFFERYKDFAFAGYFYRRRVLLIR